MEWAGFSLIKNALPAMIERGGSILINVTSDAGHVGYPGVGAYGISKIGLEGMSQTVGIGVARERCASELGRLRQYEHSDASRGRAGRKSIGMGRSRRRD